MNSEMTTFLEDLFARCPIETQTAFLTFTAIHPDGDRPTPSRHVQLNDTAQLERAVSRLLRANQAGWGAYFGVAPRQRNLGRWSRGGKADLTCLPALFVDIDHPDEALICLGWFDLPASCIIHSGRGYHAYWFLESPTTDFAFADKVIRGLAQRLNGDEALTVAQSMRLPGSVNTKMGRQEARCSFFSYHPDRLYQLDEFKPFLPKAHSHHHRLSSWEAHEGTRHELPQPLLEAMTEAVLHQLDGRWRTNGYIAARCPFPHEKDAPGMHFSYNSQSGWGYCFGKHGKVSPTELCRLFGLAIAHDKPAHAA